MVIFVKDCIVRTFGVWLSLHCAHKKTCVLNFSGRHSVYLNWRVFWLYSTVKRKSTLTRWGQSIAWWKYIWRSDSRVLKPKRNIPAARNVLQCSCDWPLCTTRQL